MAWFPDGSEREEKPRQKPAEKDGQPVRKGGNSR